MITIKIMSKKINLMDHVRTKPFQKIHGIEIYYEIHGRDTGKEPIVLLHHGMGCAKTWKEIYPEPGAYRGTGYP